LLLRVSELCDYLQWTTDETPGDDKTPVLTMRMWQRPDTSIGLKFDVTTSSTYERLPSVPDSDMHAVSDWERPTDDVAAIKSDLVAAIDRTFNADFRKLFRKAILETFPIATGVTVDTSTGQTLFVIPILWDALKPAETSVFCIRMRIAPSAGSHVRVPAIVYVAPAEPYEEPGPGFVMAAPIHECKIHRFLFDRLPHAASNAECSAQATADFPALRPFLTSEVQASAVVFVANYDRAPSVSK